MPPDTQALIEKIRKLPAERIAEVEEISSISFACASSSVR
jgi:hypothetical protein